MRRLIFCFMVLICTVGSFASVASASTTRIAAASSMRFVLDELIDAYTRSTGDAGIQVVYGSSGNIYRQIVQGAPYDLFLSADIALSDELKSAGLSKHAGTIGYGRLVLYTDLDIPAEQLQTAFFESLKSGQLNGADFRVAIANPAHAPYGKAARESLEKSALWQRVQPHLVMADKVSQAAQFAQTKSVAFAFIANALAMQLEGQSVEVDIATYQPIALTLSLLTDTPAAQSFKTYTESENAREIINRFGLRAASDVE